MDARKDLAEYLAHKKVNLMFQELLTQICIDRPENPAKFVVDFLTQNYLADGTRRDSGSNQAEEDIAPTQLSLPAVSSVVPASVPVCVAEPDVNWAEKAQQPRRRRNAIAVAPPQVRATSMQRIVVPKSDEERQQIAHVMQINMLFSGLDDHQRVVIMDAMLRREAAEGDVVIQQGDQGDHFYIIAQGAVDFLISKDGAPPVKVGSAGPGQSFGELALMYGSPRAATVVASAPCVFWVMDRDTYRNILMETVLAKRRRYQELLAQVPLLGQLTQYERSTITDALVAVDFNDGDVIVRQGDRGDTFYIIEEGEVMVTRQDPGMDGPVLVNQLHSPQFFGEVALLSAQQARRATVTALGQVRLLALDFASFTRLLGPLEEIMQRNTAQYNLVSNCGEPTQ